MSRLDELILAGAEKRVNSPATAAEAMRRILIQSARRKHARKRVAGVERLELVDADLAEPGAPLDILALSEALDLLAADDPAAANLAKLRIFAGLSVDEAGSALGLPHTSAYRQ